MYVSQKDQGQLVMHKYFIRSKYEDIVILNQKETSEMGTMIKAPV